MKAAYIERPGPPEVIRYGPLPDPVPTGTQVLVKVEAVSVNPIDTYIRAGLVPAPLPFPYVIGCDLAGRVAGLGPAASRFRPGDRVWASNQGLLGRQGTFAEFAAVDETWLNPLPDKVRAEDAAAMALVGITAHLGLFQHARLLEGETIFLQGGSGGVGSAVLQMAKLAGARVITTAGSEAKAEICRALGADLVINYRTQEVARILQEYAPQGVHVWWETLREPDFDRAIQAMAEGGRMVVMAGREARPPFPVGPFYVKNCSLHGFVMFKASPDQQRRAAEAINAWMETGRLKARIDRILPLAEAAAAHQLQEESTLRKMGNLSGKIVLKPS